MKQKIYLITGLMASGKSTVSDLLAKSIEKCVHLRGDVFRKMIISGRENMSATPSAEAVRQLYLRYKLTADAAKSYFDIGFWLDNSNQTPQQTAENILNARKPV